MRPSDEPPKKELFIDLQPNLCCCAGVPYRGCFFARPLYVLNDIESALKRAVGHCNSAGPHWGRRIGMAANRHEL